VFHFRFSFLFAWFLFCLHGFIFVCVASFLFAWFHFYLRGFFFVWVVSFLFAACPLQAIVTNFLELEVNVPRTIGILRNADI